MTVTPTSPGRVRISSVTIDYRQGAGEIGHQGRQTLPLTLGFTAR